jgi:CcmD family protein
MRTHIATLAAVLLMLIVLPATAFAATAGQAEIPGDSKLDFLLVGFGVVWAGFFAYVFYVSRKNSELQREIEDLRRTIEARAASAGSSEPSENQDAK